MSGIDVLIARSVQAGRERRRMTRAALAHRLGLPIAQMADIEAGRARASAGQLFDIADALNVEVTDFFAEARQDLPVASRTAADFGPEANDIAAHYDSLSPDHRRIVFAFLCPLETRS